MDSNKNLSKDELIKIIDLLNPTEYEIVCSIFSKLYDDKIKTSNVDKLIDVEEAKAERKRFLLRKEELDGIKKVMPDIELTKYLYSIGFETMPLSDAVIYKLSKTIKYSDCFKPQDSIVFRSTIAMFNEHMTNLELNNPNITNYNVLLNQDLITKMLLIEQDKRRVYEYINDTYGNSLRTRELGFTFSQYFNPEKAIDEDYNNKSNLRFNCLLGRYSTLENLEKRDYFEVKKLMYIRK